MFYLASTDAGSFIIESEKSPFQTIVHGHRCNSCSCGHATEAELREKSKIPDEPCRKCGSLFSTNYCNRESLLKRHFCFTCTFWSEYVEQKDNPRIARVNGVHYCANPPKGGNPSFLGFAGRQFHIRWDNGREMKTNDVWHQGTIPDRFRADLPDNAVFLLAP